MIMRFKNQESFKEEVDIYVNGLRLKVHYELSMLRIFIIKDTY